MSSNDLFPHGALKTCNITVTYFHKKEKRKIVDSFFFLFGLCDCVDDVLCVRDLHCDTRVDVGQGGRP